MAFRPVDVAVEAVEAAEADAHGRVRAVAARFRERFGRWPDGLARAPGRVNLIGEHIDYEGYSVLPMAIEQDFCVALAASASSDDGDSDGGGLRLLVQLASSDEDAYPLAEVEVALGPAGVAPPLLSGRRAWANYAVSGFLAARELLHAARCDADPLRGPAIRLQLLVDGTVPAACGLSSSSAFVVASAMAAAYALTRCGVRGFAMPSRVAVAEACRVAEAHVGTMGGGMDQAISCLGQRGHALYISFRPELRAQPVQVSGADGGYAFVVANSGVVAQKAVDATTRFNKRVVECALAAKLIGKAAALSGWQQLERLADLQEQLGAARGQAVDFSELQQLAVECCPLREYTLAQIESPEGLGGSVPALFEASSMRAGVERVLAASSASTPFLLQQRAHHVWAEAERVEQFRALCASLGEDPAPDAAAQAITFAELGRLMLESHRSCQLLYECSCAELDALVAAAMAHGALGARLTGAGWGGCIVVLAPNSRVSAVMQALRETIGLRSGEKPDAVFRTEPAAGADIFSFAAN